MTTTNKKSARQIEYAKENLKRIPLDVKKEKYNQIKKYAEDKNISVRGFIIQAIEHEMENDLFKTAFDNIKDDNKFS